MSQPQDDDPNEPIFHGQGTSAQADSDEGGIRETEGLKVLTEHSPHFKPPEDYEYGAPPPTSRGGIGLGKGTGEDPVEQIKKILATAPADSSGMEDGESYYIQLRTDAKGVNIPEDLKDHFPELIGFVLQFQFEGFRMQEDRFSVRLWFSGEDAIVEVPYDAIVSIKGPSDVGSFSIPT